MPVLAVAAVAVRLATADPADVQASSGMYAAGDAMTFLGVFGLVAIVPTAFVLFLVRERRRVWTVLATVGTAVALTGVAAIVLYVTSRASGMGTVAGELAGLSPLRMLAAPLLALAFLVAGFVAPRSRARLALFGCAVAEALVTFCTAWMWLSPLARR